MSLAATAVVRACRINSQPGPLSMVGRAPVELSQRRWFVDEKETFMSDEVGKHSRGTWKIRVEGTMSGRGPEVYVEGEYYDDGSELVVADCGTTETSKDGHRWKRVEDAAVKEANAKLIRASPELAEALRALLEIIRRGGVASAKDLETCKRAEKLLSEVVG